MLFLQNIWLKNFKNYRETELVFKEPLVCISGPNGAGKTNLLDAIHYLCLCKSYFNPVDSQNVHHKADFFTLKGQFKENDKVDELFCNLVKRKNKTFKRNNKEYDRLSDHVGRFPVVMIAPGDLTLVTGGSAERRKFVDAIIGQYNKRYLNQLIQYNKLIKQRNSLLKQFAEEHRFDASLINSIDEQVIPLGNEIHEVRQQFWTDFMPVFQKVYNNLSDHKETVQGEYRSRLNEQDLSTLLQEYEEKDRALQRTTTGPHKDDFKFLIEGYPLKKFGSQGQQKSFVHSLKLTQYQLLAERTGSKPLLLLDDVFDRLDHDRVKRLLSIVLDASFGQVFLTDTQPDRVDKVLEPFEHVSQKCFIEAGKIV